MEVVVEVGILEALHPGRGRDLGVDQLPDDVGRVDRLDQVALAWGECPNVLTSTNENRFDLG